MKKRFIILIILFIFLNIFLIKIKAQEPSIPNVPIIGNNTEEKVEQFQGVVENLSDNNTREAFIKQTKDAAIKNIKFIGPIILSTKKVFVFFNPLWRFLFGIEAELSWEFVLSLFMWIVIIILAYSTFKAFLTDSNPFLIFFIGLCIASLVAISRGIKQGVNLVSHFIKNIWLLILSLAIAVFIVVLYKQVMKKIEKNNEENAKKRKEERREQKQKALDEVTKNKLKMEGLD